jgi:glutamate dehydrogenase (NAD(P)+)
VRGREEATGRGVFYGIREACSVAEDMKKLGLSAGTKGKTFVLQGLGNVGTYSGSICQDEGGMILVGAGEMEGAVYNPDGIDVHDLLKYRKQNGSILNYPGAQSFDKAQRELALEFECDVLIPAALESVITSGNVSKIKAKIIAEAANGPIAADAEEILLAAGKLIIPDFYLNAGGVTVSYFEWLKNLSHMRFGRMDKRFNQGRMMDMVNLVERMTGRDVTAEEMKVIARGADEIDLVRSGLEETMITAYHQMREVMVTHPKINDLRTAAMVNAISKISNDYMSLGIWP